MACECLNEDTVLWRECNDDQRLVALLKEAEADYNKSTKELEWAAWYAVFMLPYFNVPKYGYAVMSLAEYLRSTGKAHHKFEQDRGMGRHENWAVWYAAFLLPKLSAAIEGKVFK